MPQPCEESLGGSYGTRLRLGRVDFALDPPASRPAETRLGGPTVEQLVGACWGGRVPTVLSTLPTQRYSRDCWNTGMESERRTTPCAAGSRELGAADIRHSITESLRRIVALRD